MCIKKIETCARAGVRWRLEVRKLCGVVVAKTTAMDPEPGPTLGTLNLPLTNCQHQLLSGQLFDEGRNANNNSELFS